MHVKGFKGSCLIDMADELCILRPQLSEPNRCPAMSSLLRRP
jgi:hypothetical protein